MQTQIVQQNPNRQVNLRVNRDPYRKVFDNIHGFVRFQKRVWLFIDTPEFQKLRYIKQLGCLSHVFPGATHSRFEHSLGTGHVAKTFIELLIKNNPQRYPDEEQRKSAIFTVTLAGIMHDIGHGPFSHTFDQQVVKCHVLQPNSTEQKDEWKHELGSEIIFKHIVATNPHIQNYIKPEQVLRVISLIHGKSDGVRQWQFQLISNSTTGIDVDKLDYFRRDAFYLGAKGVEIDHDLLMNEARIIQDNSGTQPKYVIGYPSKYALQVNEIFSSRYKLYKIYYLNNKSKCIELMIMDVLNLVQPIFNFTNICRNIKQGPQWINKYVGLTDGILQRIQYLDETQSKYQNHRQAIKKAREILLRIKNRDIYRFVREVQTSITEQHRKPDSDILKGVFNVDNIKDYIHDITNIPKEQFHIAVPEAGYGLKQVNPLDRVKFFRKEDFGYQNQNEEHRCLSAEEFKAQNISILYTKAFSEKFAKLFVKSVTNGDRVIQINNAFYQYFQLKRQQYGDIFNHMNMGRTHFYPTAQLNVNGFNPNQQNPLP